MKETNMKGYKQYNFNFMTFWERQNNKDSKKVSGCQGWGIGREMNKQITEDF